MMSNRHHRFLSGGISNCFLYGVLLLWGSLLCSCDGRSLYGLPLAAGIFGIGGNNKDGQNQNPPPPGQRGPPPPQRFPNQVEGRPLPSQQGTPPREGPPPRPPIPQSVTPSIPRQPQQQRHGMDPRPPPSPPSRNEDVQQSSGLEIENESELVGSSTPGTEDDGSQSSLNETSTEVSHEKGENGDNDNDGEVDERPPPPPMPPPQWGVNSFQNPPPPQGWMGPPPRDNSGWEGPPPPVQEWSQQESLPYYEQNSGMYGDMGHPMLQQELDYSLAREHDLIEQVQNLTTTISTLEQREELHVRQLDVLTERVMDVESLAASDRNSLLEYEANCTALTLTIATLNDELEDWQKRCTEFSDLLDQDAQKLSEVRQRLKEKTSEAEDLAIAIENLRLAEREASNSRRKQKKTGLFSWLFGFLVSSDGGLDDFETEEAYEMAKSTLLRALQTERSSVHELEAAVASLQQNNSAISQMVDSRDMIIDELNNRIAVFEEDKVVLKAALKQLQKEMTEEAPRTQKLMDEVTDAKKEVKRLNSEINEIIRTHQAEIKALQKTIAVKQKAISETESNLTSIGTYVDKLEERLTSYAVTRRDMENREKKCKEVEEAATKREEEIKSLTAKNDDYAKQQDELKKLLEELAEERSNLQSENRKLMTDRELRMGDEKQLKDRISSFESELPRLRDDLNEWKTKAESLAPVLEAANAANEELQTQLKQMNELELECESLNSENAQLRADYHQTQEDLQAAVEENQRLIDEQAAIDETEESTDEGEDLSEDEGEGMNEDRQGEQQQPAEPRIPDTRIPPPRQARPPRDIPLRMLRKRISKLTGVHGLLTPSSEMVRLRLGRKPLIDGITPPRFQARQPAQTKIEVEGSRETPSERPIETSPERDINASPERETETSPERAVPPPPPLPKE